MHTQMQVNIIAKSALNDVWWRSWPSSSNKSKRLGKGSINREGSTGISTAFHTVVNTCAYKRDRKINKTNSVINVQERISKLKVPWWICFPCGKQSRIGGYVE